MEIVEEQRRVQARLFRDVRDARLARALRFSATARRSVASVRTPERCGPSHSALEADEKRQHLPRRP